MPRTKKSEMERQYGIIKKCPSQETAHKKAKRKPGHVSQLLRSLGKYCCDHPELDAYSAAVEALCGGPFNNLTPTQLRFN